MFSSCLHLYIKKLYRCTYSFLYVRKGCVIMIDVNLNKINKSYGTEIVLKDIDMTIQKGEKVALIGANGSGKTTIL